MNKPLSEILQDNPGEVEKTKKAIEEYKEVNNMWTCSCGTIWSDEQEFCEFCNEEDFQSGICKVCNYKSFTLEGGICHSCRIEEISFMFFTSDWTEEEHERKEELERARGEV